MNKTVYLFGAGSTQFLKMPTSNEQSHLIYNYNGSNNYILTIKKICEYYFGKNNYEMNDIYNLIDNAILLHSSLCTGDPKNSSLDYMALEKCKIELIKFIFRKMLEYIISYDKYNYDLLVQFYYKLAETEINKKINLLDFSNREEMVSSYSIINLNWDLYSLMPILEANNIVNHHNKLYIPKDINPQLCIYTDFNCEYGKQNKEEVWYPYTEAAAHMVNSYKYRSTRNVILTKCFYPHGAMNLFKCPHCGKHSYYLSDLTLKGIINELNYDNFQYNCPYCNNIISCNDIDALAQSNFKIRNSYLEEIRLSMTNELRHADKIIFIGYSFPNDDQDYKTMFKSLRDVKEIYIVLKDDNGINKFLSKDELNGLKNWDEIERIEAIFKGKNIKYNLAGFPNAISEILKIN